MRSSTALFRCWAEKMKTRRKAIIALCVALIAPVILFATWRCRIFTLTRRVEHAGGFVGSSQPPDWMNPVYNLICHVDLFLEPYQIILDRDAVADEALPAVQALPHLRILEFEDMAIKRESLDRIKRMRQLETLEFRRCSLPQRALDELHESLPQVKIVEKK